MRRVDWRRVTIGYNHDVRSSNPGSLLVRSYKKPFIAANFDSLAGLFVLADPAKVARFLAQHPELVGLLLEARPELRRCFGEAPVRLQVVSDPEAPGPIELFGYIATDLEASEALERLRRFDAEWFIEHRAEAGELLNFDVEFL